MGMTDEECMQYVIGGEWNLDTKDGLKFVYEVANAGGVDILKAMLEKTSDAASSTVRGGQTALFGAAQKDRVECIELLIAAKANVNHQDKEGCTALHIAAQKGRTAAVRLLLESKADTSIQTNDDPDGVEIIGPDDNGEMHMVPCYVVGTTALQVALQDAADVIALLGGAVQKRREYLETDIRNVKCNYDMDEESAKANISSAFPGRHAVMERLELLVSKIDENSDGLLSKQELVNILVHADLTGEKLSRRKAQKEAEDMVGEAGLSGEDFIKVLAEFFCNEGCWEEAGPKLKNLEVMARVDRR